MWSFVVVEGEKLVESSEPPALLVVGLEKPLNLSIRLWPTNLAQRVDTRSLVLVCVDEL